MLTILKTVVAQIDVLETMTPRQFQTIRRSDPRRCIREHVASPAGRCGLRQRSPTPS
jgi:hypothetical protein